MSGFHDASFEVRSGALTAREAGEDGPKATGRACSWCSGQPFLGRLFEGVGASVGGTPSSPHRAPGWGGGAMRERAAGACAADRFPHMFPCVGELVSEWVPALLTGSHCRPTGAKHCRTKSRRRGFSTLGFFSAFSPPPPPLARGGGVNVRAQRMRRGRLFGPGINPTLRALPNRPLRGGGSTVSWGCGTPEPHSILSESSPP